MRENRHTAQNDTSKSGKLKIRVQNDINVYTHYSLPLCFLLTDDRLYPWYCEHYLQIYSKTDSKGHLVMDFLEHLAPYRMFTEQTCFTHMDMENVADIIEFLIKKIDEHSYVVIYADEYYLECKDVYMKAHYVQPSLIYGYDNATAKLMAVGTDKENMLAEFIFGYDAFTEAFRQGGVYYKDQVTENGQSAVETIMLLEVKEYPFSIDSFLEKLGDYIHAKGDASIAFCRRLEADIEPGGRIKYGMDVYADIVEHLKNMSDGKTTMDFRQVHLLHEHKNAVYRRLKFVAERYNVSVYLSGLIERYAEIIGDSEAICRIYMRQALAQHAQRIENYALKAPQEKEFVNRLADTVNSIREKEYELLYEIYIRLKSEIKLPE